ncbi:hypothetical protein BHE74_00029944 [Ensete ventricosum]|nr:hypothetical protein BHE74_00029944 [Ensete ventricosum]
MKEIEAFLAANPSEIVTLILEDYVETPNGLPKLFNDSGLTKYWFPVSSMPQNGQDWPLVSDMVASNQRLVVFTSIISKQDTEGVAYQWNYMVENQYLEIYFSSDYVDGDDGMEDGKCFNRAESASLSDTTKSLVLVNYFSSIPVKQTTCEDNSGRLINMLNTCYVAANNRWANFVAVDFYKVLLLLSLCLRYFQYKLTDDHENHKDSNKCYVNFKKCWIYFQRSDGGGSFQATDMLNGRLLCGCDDVHACVAGSTPGACSSP